MGLRSVAERRNQRSNAPRPTSSQKKPYRGTESAFVNNTKKTKSGRLDGLRTLSGWHSGIGCGIATKSCRGTFGGTSNRNLAIPPRSGAVLPPPSRQARCGTEHAESNGGEHGLYDDSLVVFDHFELRSVTERWSGPVGFSSSARLRYFRRPLLSPTAHVSLRVLKS
jgi:hypothetical protein